MDASLTVLLPVRNEQSNLRAIVSEVIEVAAELTTRLDVVIVDDASHDATIEVAEELRRVYPQLRVTRRSESADRMHAIRAGLELGMGEIIMLRDSAGGDSINEMPRLWRMLTKSEFASGGSVPGSFSLETRAAIIGRKAGYHLVPRSAIEEFLSPRKPARPNFLDRTSPLTTTEEELLDAAIETLDEMSTWLDDAKLKGPHQPKSHKPSETR